MKHHCALAVGLAVAVVIACAGCGQSPTAEADPSGDFPAGAFPPTMSDMDYHQDAWSRTDCLVCHETGVDGATVIKHVSVPPTAMEAKCRTCHVLVPGSKPAD